MIGRFDKAKSRQLLLLSVEGDVSPGLCTSFGDHGYEICTVMPDILASPPFAGFDAAVIAGRSGAYPADVRAALRRVKIPIICVLPPDPNEELALLDAGAALCLPTLTRPQDLVRWTDRLIELSHAPWPASFSFDAARRQARYKERDIGLRPREFDLLFLLARAFGRPQDGGHLRARLWPDETAPPERLSVHVHQLRRALTIVGAAGWLRTIPGPGYALCAPPRRRAR